MTVKQLNPEAVIIDQLQDHWQKIAALLVWKLAPNGVELTHEDMLSFPADKALMTYGMTSKIGFKIVSQEEAARITAYDQTNNRGRA